MTSLDPALSAVPTPTNLVFEAFNLNAMLHWQYPSNSSDPVFTVEVKTYRKGRWIEACRTTHHYCNISPQIDDPSLPLWVRVKARVGQNESEYANSEDFTLCRNGKIGPPKVVIRREKDFVITDIFHPLRMINSEESEPIYDEEDSCYLFFYDVYVKTSENETGDIIQSFPVEDCNETQCFISFSVSSLNSEYCVSAKGVSERWDVSTEMSEELCIPIFHNDTASTQVLIPVVVTSMFFIGVVLITVISYRKKISPCKKENIVLPKSLLSVVKSPPEEQKPESKHTSLITYQPIPLQTEKVVSEPELSPAMTSSVHAEDNPEKGEHREELPSETEVLNTEMDASNTTTSDSALTIRRDNSLHSSSNLSEPSSVALNAYHSRNGSDSGLVVSGSLLSDSEFSSTNKAEIKTEQECIVLPNTTTSFGYDKPHVLIDLVVDDDSKESLIGYRLTTDTKDFS